MGELNLYGVYVPVLLVQAIIAYAVLKILMQMFEAWIETGWIAMPGVFCLCLYVVILGAVHWCYVLFAAAI